MPRCRDTNDLCCVGKLVKHSWMGSWEIQSGVIYARDIDTICSLPLRKTRRLKDDEARGRRILDTQRTEWQRGGEEWDGEESGEGKGGYGCWERVKDSSHASGQVLGWCIQSMTSLLCGWVELLGSPTALAPPLLWFCLGRIKKAQMEHRTWRWAGSPKMSRSRPSACGRLVRSTLVRAEHRLIHTAKAAYPGLCNDCVTTEKPLSLTQGLSLRNLFGLSSHAAVLVQMLEPEQGSQPTGNWGGTTALTLH